MNIETLHEIEKLKEDKKSFCIYFSSPNCGVCQVLKPQIKNLINTKFSNLEYYQVDTTKFPEIAAQLGFYTNPSLIIYLNGREFIRKSRSISLQELETSLSRPYKLMF